MATNNQKVEKLKKVMDVINREKKYKSNSRDNAPICGIITDMSADVETYSTGSLVLDNVLGGGFGKGRIVEIYGKESSGKTSIAISTAANVQHDGGTVLYIDVENAFDPHYAHALGVNLDELAFSQPSSAEQTLDLISDFTESGLVDLIVVDSVAAMVPEAELNGESSDRTVGELARLLSKELRKLIKKASDNGTSIIFINQTRDKIGGFSPFGVPQTTTGGQALKFYASQRVETKKGQPVKGDTPETKNKVIGTELKLKVVKNKIAPPYMAGETVISYAKGINRAAEMIEVGPELGAIIKPNNRRYETPDGDLIGTSKADAIEFLENNPELLEELSDNLRQKLADVKLGSYNEHEDKKDKSAPKGEATKKIDELDEEPITDLEFEDD